MLAEFIRLDHGVARGGIVGRRVLVLGVLTAAHVAAGEAPP
jgi:hypothetical protein